MSRKTIFFTIILVIAVCLALSSFGKGMDETRTDELLKAVRRCAVSCYAIEGFYPGDISYLEENYGLMIDREHYRVYYDTFASNIMPEITVLEIG